MFCLSRCKLLGLTLHPLGAMPLPAAEGPMYPEWNITTPWSPYFSPGHSAVGPSSFIHLLSFQVPPLASSSGVPPEEHHYLQLRWSWFAVSGSEAVRCRATRLHAKGVLNAPSASLQAIDKGSRGESKHSNWSLQHIYWMGSHRPEEVSATPPVIQPAPKWASANGPKLTPGLQFQTLPFLQGNETLYNAVMNWNTHCSPQGSPMKIGAGSR